MITRIYADNFRSLVNFEWRPGRIALLLGENGSGKSSVVEVIWGIRDLVVQEMEVKQAFPPHTRTLWTTRPEQRFELDVMLDSQPFRYQLVLAHDLDDARKSKIRRETLRLGELVLMDCEDGELRLHRDDGSAGPRLEVRASRSGLGSIYPNKDNKHLTAFKRWLAEETCCIKPDPRAMSAHTDQEGEALDKDMGNFASWYGAWVGQDLNAVLRAQEQLREAIRGFDSLLIHRKEPLLQVKFQASEGQPAYFVDFDELSDGQKQLCALYILLHAQALPGRLLVLDEPDNYVALREIQPWLTQLVDAALLSDGPQIWLISHHPELLNQLAPDFGTRFFRTGGTTRIEPFKGQEGLSSAEVVARGWDGE